MASASVLDERDSVAITNQTEALMSMKKGGRLKGTTNHSKKELSDVIIAAKNKIVDMYSKEKRNDYGKLLKTNTPKNIIREVKQKETYQMMLIFLNHLSARLSRKSPRNINMTYITISNTQDDHCDYHHPDGMYLGMSHPIKRYHACQLTNQGHAYSSQTDRLKKTPLL